MLNCIVILLCISCKNIFHENKGWQISEKEQNMKLTSYSYNAITVVVNNHRILVCICVCVCLVCGVWCHGVCVCVCGGASANYCDVLMT